MHRALRLAGLAFLAGFGYSLIEPYRVLVRRHDVNFDDLAPELDGLRIAHLSDLHCSAITSSALLARFIDACNAQRPDVVLMTGDYVSRRDSYSLVTLARLWAKPVMEYAWPMAREVGRLQAPDGVYAVPGNHDYSEGYSGYIDDLLHEQGVVTLVNRSTLLRGLLPLIGLDDLRAGRPQIEAAFQGVDAARPQVVLSHNPRLIEAVSDRNCLMLAGHTHAGQVHLPFTKFRRRPRDMRGSELFQGWYRRGQARLYISAGLGSVNFPIRFRCPPEIAIITLRRSV